MARARAHGTNTVHSLGFVEVEVPVRVYHTNTGNYAGTVTEGDEFHTLYWQPHSSGRQEKMNIRGLDCIHTDTS